MGAPRLRLSYRGTRADLIRPGVRRVVIMIGRCRAVVWQAWCTLKDSIRKATRTVFNDSAFVCERLREA